MKKSGIRKFFSLITAAFLALNQLGITSQAWGGLPLEVKIPSSGFQLNLPPDLGTIQNLISGSGPTVIHIQTAHGNYEAQKKIQAILHYLKETYGFKLLLLEGTSFKLEPELLHFFPKERELTMKVADELAKKALLKGAELFLLEDKGAQAYGVENLESYVANGEAFKTVLTQKEKSENFLRDMDLQIERLTSPYLNKDLRAFLKRIEDYELKNLPFLDWLFYLKNKAKESLEFDLTDPTNQIDWPMLLRIYKLREFESKIDLNAFAKEREEFLSVIARARSARSNLITGIASASVGTLPRNDIEEIKHLLSSPLSQNQFPDPETGLLFERMVSYLPPNFDYKAYPNVNYFIGHLILQSELKGERLFEEMTRLTDKISEKLAKTPEEKKILNLLKDHRLLKKLFALELAPTDYEAILSRGENLRPGKMAERFLELNKMKRVRGIEFTYLKEIDSLFNQALEFYRGVKERDGGMLQNIEARLSAKGGSASGGKETGADKAIVITGGFHAEPFKKFFQGKGYNYALVAPKITSTEGKEAYIAASLQNSPTQFIRATRESPFPYALPLNKAEQEKVDAAWALDQLIRSELHVVDEAGKITEINELANGSPASRNFGLTYRSPVKGPQGKEGVIVTIGNQETFIPFGGTRIIKTVIEEERPTLDLTKGVSRRATTPSIRSEVRMGDILGARKEPTPYPLPQPTEAIPADLLPLQEAEKRLKENFPALYPYYEQIKRKYFADFMPGAAGIFEMEGEKTFLIEKHYWNYAVGVLPYYVPALLIYLHLVHELTRLALTPLPEPLSLDLNLELIAFIAQTAAYDRLTREEKEHLRNAASFLDTRDPELQGRFSPVIAFMDQFDAVSIRDQASHEKIIRFLTQYPGFDPTTYDPKKVSEYFSHPVISSMMEGPLDPITQADFQGNGELVHPFGLTVHEGILYISRRGSSSHEDVDLLRYDLTQKKPLAPINVSAFRGHKVLPVEDSLVIHEGILYIASHASQEILRYDLVHDQPLTSLTDTTFGKHIGFPSGLALDGGILYSTNYDQGNILRYDLVRKQAIPPLTQTDLPEMSFRPNGGLTVHQEILYLGASDKIHRYDLLHKRALLPLTEANFQGKGKLSLDRGSGLTIHEGILYISGRDEILRHDLATYLALSPLTQANFQGKGTLKHPLGLTVDKSVLYIASEESNEILRYVLPPASFPPSPAHELDETRLKVSLLVAEAIEFLEKKSEALLENRPWVWKTHRGHNLAITVSPEETGKYKITFWAVSTSRVESEITAEDPVALLTGAKEEIRGTTAGNFSQEDEQLIDQKIAEFRQRMEQIHRAQITGMRAAFEKLPWNEENVTGGKEKKTEDGAIVINEDTDRTIFEKSFSVLLKEQGEWEISVFHSRSGQLTLRWDKKNLKVPQLPLDIVIPSTEDPLVTLEAPKGEPMMFDDEDRANAYEEKVKLLIVLRDEIVAEMRRQGVSHWKDKAWRILSESEWKSQPRSEVRTSQTVDLLGARRKPTSYPMPQPTQEIPSDVLKNPEASLGRSYPRLYEEYKNIRRKYFADFMQGAAGIYEMEGGRVLLLEDRYQDLPEEVSQEARDLLLYLHLVQGLTALSLVKPGEILPPDFNRELAAFMAQVTAYHSLTEREKELLHTTVQHLDQNLLPEDQRFLPVIDFMNSLDFPSVLDEENREKLLDFMTRYPGLSKKDYDPQKLKGYITGLSLLNSWLRWMDEIKKAEPELRRAAYEILEDWEIQSLNPRVIVSGIYKGGNDVIDIVIAGPTTQKAGTERLGIRISKLKQDEYQNEYWVFATGIEDKYLEPKVHVAYRSQHIPSVAKKALEDLKRWPLWSDIVSQIRQRMGQTPFDLMQEAVEFLQKQSWTTGKGVQFKVKIFPHEEETYLIDLVVTGHPGSSHGGSILAKDPVELLGQFEPILERRWGEENKLASGSKQLLDQKIAEFQQQMTSEEKKQMKQKGAGRGYGWTVPVPPFEVSYGEDINDRDFTFSKAGESVMVSFRGVTSWTVSIRAGDGSELVMNWNKDFGRLSAVRTGPVRQEVVAQEDPVLDLHFEEATATFSLILEDKVASDLRAQGWFDWTGQTVWRILSESEWKSQPRSEVRTSQTMDLLGARRKPTAYPIPQPTREIPVEVLKNAEAKLKENYPNLYAAYEQIKRKYFADFMPGAAGIYEMEGERVFLLEDRYANLAEGVSKEARDLLIFLHLVHGLSKQLLAQPKEISAPSFRQALLTFMAQAHAYYNLTSEEKAILYQGAEILDQKESQDPEEHRFTPVIRFMDQLVDFSSFAADMNITRLIQFLNQYPGLNRPLSPEDLRDIERFMRYEVVKLPEVRQTLEVIGFKAQHKKSTGSVKLPDGMEGVISFLEGKQWTGQKGTKFNVVITFNPPFGDHSEGAYYLSYFPVPKHQGPSMSGHRVSLETPLELLSKFLDLWRQDKEQELSPQDQHLLDQKIAEFSDRGGAAGSSSGRQRMGQGVGVPQGVKLVPRTRDELFHALDSSVKSPRLGRLNRMDNKIVPGKIEKRGNKIEVDFMDSAHGHYQYTISIEHDPTGRIPRQIRIVREDVHDPDDLGTEMDSFPSPSWLNIAERDRSWPLDPLADVGIFSDLSKAVIVVTDKAFDLLNKTKYDFKRHYGDFELEVLSISQAVVRYDELRDVLRFEPETGIPAAESEPRLLRSEVRTSQTVDLLGARRKPTSYPMPQPTGEIPTDVLKNVETKLKNTYPSLYTAYEQIKRKYFADFMQGAAGIYEMEGERVLLLEDRYANLPQGVSQEARDQLIYLHLIQGLMELTLVKSGEAIAPDINRELAAFMAQVTAYHSLTDKEKELLRKAAEVLDRQEPDPSEQRFTPVLTFMGQFEKDSVFAEENRRKIVDFLAQYPGLDSASYNAQNVAVFIEELRKKLSPPLVEPSLLRDQLISAWIAGDQGRLQELIASFDALVKTLENWKVKIADLDHRDLIVVSRDPSERWPTIGTVDAFMELFSMDANNYIETSLKERADAIGFLKEQGGVQYIDSYPAAVHDYFRLATAQELEEIRQRIAQAKPGDLMQGAVEFINRHQWSTFHKAEWSVYVSLDQSGTLQIVVERWGSEEQLSWWSSLGEDTKKSIDLYAGNSPVELLETFERGLTSLGDSLNSQDAEALREKIAEFRQRMEKAKPTQVTGMRVALDALRSPPWTGGIPSDHGETSSFEKTKVLSKSTTAHISISLEKNGWWTISGDTGLLGGVYPFRFWWKEGSFGMKARHYEFDKEEHRSFNWDEQTSVNGVPQDPLVKLYFDEKTNVLTIVLRDEVIMSFSTAITKTHSSGGVVQWHIISESDWKAQQRSEVRTSQPELEAVIGNLTTYYEAKQRLIEAIQSNHIEAYREAFQAMETSAKEIASPLAGLAMTNEVLEQALTAVRDKGVVRPEILGEAQEILRAANPPLTEEHRKIIREVAREVAYAMTFGTRARELEKDLISRTREMRLDDMIPSELPKEPLTPEQIAAHLEWLEHFSHADADKFLGIQKSSYEEGRPSEIALRPILDPILSRAAYLHEVIHELAHQGFLPILVDRELITHAATALEIVHAKGIEGLREFGGDLYVKLFEEGEELFKKEEPADDLEKMLHQTHELYLKHLEESGQAPPEMEKAEEKVLVLTPVEWMRQFFEFERLIGTLLGGYAWEREKQTERNGLAYLFDYAVDVLGRTDLALAPLRENPAFQKNRRRLHRTLQGLAKVLGKQSLEIKDWRSEKAGEIPEVRYEDDPFNPVLTVPPAVWFLDQTVAKGLVMQEIHRANPKYSGPELVEERFKENEIFKELFRIVDTPRVIEAASPENPGSRMWINRYYEFRHRLVPSLPIVQERVRELPLPFQYFTAVLWLWHKKEIDPRITDKRVLEALQNTQAALEEAFHATPERHYEITRDVLWPVVEKLREEAVRDRMIEKAMNQMIQEGKLELTDEQKEAFRSGRLKPELLDENQRRQVEESLSEMPQEEKEKGEQEAAQEVDRGGKSFQEQFGAQATGGLTVVVIFDVNQPPQGGGTPQGMDALFPKPGPPIPQEPEEGPTPPEPPSIEDLAQAMNSLVQGAQALEQLARQAGETAQHLREKAGELGQKEEILELAKSLDELAKKLREEAQGLQRGAQEFHHDASQARKAMEDEKKDLQKMLDLLNRANELLQRTNQLGKSTGNLETQTQRVRERAKKAPESITPDLAQGLQDYTDRLKEQVSDIHGRTKQLSELTKAIAEALAKGELDKPAKPQETTAKPTAETPKGEMKQPLKPLDFSPLPETPEKPTGIGGPGYGPGMREGVETPLIERKEQAETEPPAPKPSPKEFEPGKPVSEEELEKAREVIRKIPPRKERPKPPTPEPAPTEEVTKYLAKRAGYEGPISEISSTIDDQLKKTKRKKKRGGLERGDFLSPKDIAKIKLTPPKVMGRRDRPGRFDHYIGILVDVSSSTNPRWDQPFETSTRYYESVAAMNLREAARDKPGIQTEEYAFGADPEIKLRDYGEKLSDELAAQIDEKIRRTSQDATADVVALDRAIQRVKKLRPDRPGLRVFGIGIGPETKEVKEAYAPYGHQIDTPEELPGLFAQLLEKEISAEEPVPNIIFVLTDGNPGVEKEEHADALQKLIQDNRDEWAPEEGQRSEVRSTGQEKPRPYKYVTEKVESKEETYLEIHGQRMWVGPGGDLVPNVEILPVQELALPPPADGVDSYPADYVARLELAEGGAKQEILVPLSPYNMKKLAEMMAYFSLPLDEFPNLYLWGPAGTAKNTLLYLLAGMAKRPVYLMSLNFNTSQEELVALQTYTETGGKGNVHYQLSPFIQGANDPRGAISVLDEIDKPQTPGVQMALVPLLDPGRSITLENGETYVADKHALFVVMGNASPDEEEAIYAVNPPPDDFKDRFTKIQMIPLFAPRQRDETDADEKSRASELEFILRLQAPKLYATKDFYRYQDRSNQQEVIVSGKQFVKQLVLLAQDTFKSYEDKKRLPRPLTIRGLIRMVRRLNLSPDDIYDFADVLGSSYNLIRLRKPEFEHLESLIENRLPGLWRLPNFLGGEPSAEILHSHIETRQDGTRYYQILNEKNKVLAQVQVASEEPRVKAKRHFEHQTVLQHKLKLMKAMMLGEHALIYGHTGAGKTELTRDFLTNDLHRPPFRTQLNPQSETSALWGTVTMKEGKQIWQKSPTLLAMDDGLGHGHPNLIDDIGKVEDQEVNASINNILAFGHIMTPYGLVSEKDGFLVVATTTPADLKLYKTHELSAEVEDRFYLVYADYMTAPEEKEELKRKFPNLPLDFLERFVDAARELRDLWKKERRLPRPVTPRVLVGTLGIFEKDNRTLFEIFLDKYGVSKKAYQDAIEEVFKKPEYDLFDVRRADLKAPPTIEEIVGEEEESQRGQLLRRLIQSFVGDTGKKRFTVTGVVTDEPVKVEIGQIGKTNKYQVFFPEHLYVVQILDALITKPNVDHFSNAEKQILNELFTRLTTPPVQPATGVPELDTRLKYLLTTRDDFVATSALRGIEAWLEKNGWPANQGQSENLGKLLEWIQTFKLTPDKVKTITGKVLKRRSEVRSLIGLASDQDPERLPLPTARVEDEKMLRRIGDHLGRLLEGAGLPEIKKAYYALELSSYAAYTFYEGEPILLLDEILKSAPSQKLEEAWLFLQALLMAHEAFQLNLRKTETLTADLTEELALFAEVDRRLWNKIKGENREALMTLAAQLDLQEPDRPDRLKPSLERLDRFSQMPDEDTTWIALAQELKQYPGFSSLSLDMQRFIELRNKISSLQPKPETPPPQKLSQSKQKLQEIENQLRNWLWRDEEFIDVGMVGQVVQKKVLYYMTGSSKEMVIAKRFVDIQTGKAPPKRWDVQEWDIVHPSAFKNYENLVNEKKRLEEKAGKTEEEVITAAIEDIRHFGWILNKDFVSSTAVSPDGKLLAVGTGERKVETGFTIDLEPPIIYLYDLEQRASVGSFETSDQVQTEIVFSPDAKMLASRNKAGATTVWDISNPQEVKPVTPIQISTNPSNALEFSEDSTQLLEEKGGEVVERHALARAEVREVTRSQTVPYLSPAQRTLSLVFLGGLILWNVYVGILNEAGMVVLTAVVTALVGRPIDSEKERSRVRIRKALGSLGFKLPQKGESEASYAYLLSPNIALDWGLLGAIEELFLRQGSPVAVIAETQEKKRQVENFKGTLPDGSRDFLIVVEKPEEARLQLSREIARLHRLKKTQALDDFGFRALVGFDEGWLASLLRKDRFDVSPVTHGQFRRFAEGLGIIPLIETFLKAQFKIQVSA